MINAATLCIKANPQNERCATMLVEYSLGLGSSMSEIKTAIETLVHVGPSPSRELALFLDVFAFAASRNKVRPPPTRIEALRRALSETTFAPVFLFAELLIVGLSLTRIGRGPDEIAAVRGRTSPD